MTVNLQVMNTTGQWMTINTIQASNDQMTNLKLQELKRQYSNRQVRAVTPEGNVLNIM